MLPRRLFAIYGLALTSLLFLPLSSCTNIPDSRSKMVVSVKDQTMVLTQDGQPVKAYKVSTSKYGLGDIHRSCRTPLGKMQVVRKIGGGAPSGAVFKSRRRTGEVIRPNAPGRDPIVTRIMWLKGLERCNRHAYERYIYIHGTPEERNIGRPVSYGCIRMTSSDVIDLYSRIGVGAQVEVVRGSLSSTREGREYAKAIDRQREAQEAAVKGVADVPEKSEHATVALEDDPDEA
ncbi:hypothetical protein Rhal01_00887 [Rubritalea halochordaticola]|uniref:L,D-TPase catalytic domain-containing protein n=1 Tax=Rubritalea halochordaticola TaxID=714537 RepID=A0ABP9UW87_9BACT